MVGEVSNNSAAAKSFFVLNAFSIHQESEAPRHRLSAHAHRLSSLDQLSASRLRPCKGYSQIDSQH
jgi:hypothetical protein